MSWHEDFSEADYQHYWNFAPEDRDRQIHDALTSEPLKALLAYQQGRYWLEKQELAKALDSLDAALAVRSGWHEIWTDRAAILLQVGDFDAAIASCDQSLDLDPTDAKAWSIRGTAFSRLKRYQEAAESCDRALELNPEDYQTWRTHSDALHQLGRYVEAVESYDKTLDLQPDDPYTWGDRGSVLQKLGRYDEAIESYDRLLAAEPKNHKLWYQRGLALRRLGRMEGAVANFDQALEIRPDFYAATRSKLFLLLANGQLFSYFSNERTLAEQRRFRSDLQNVFESFVKTKMPTLVVLALVVLSSTHSRTTALIISAIFLSITWIGELISESRK